MSKFALLKIEAVKGKQKFYKLEKDGKCKFDDFENEARRSYSKELFRIYALMDKVSDMQTLTKEQFRDITPKGDLTKEYEFKTHNLRVYAIHEAHTGKIIVLGGFKNTQNQDINKFRELKKQYLLEGTGK